MPRICAVATLVSAALAAGSVVVAAQDPILSPKLQFEVASVKVNTSRTRAPMQWQPGGRFVMGLPIASLISLGYGVPDARILGMPDWVRTVFFDIDARADRDPTLDERRAYYRGLLEDRFKVAVHTELRELPAYALVLARGDGRLGPGLRRSEVDCAPVIAANVARAEGGERPAPPPPGERPICSGIGGPASFTGGAVEISALTGLLASGLQRPVIDRTGLTGRFDIDFRSAPMRTAGPAAAPASELPAVFTAVQEQLGLKLETTTAPVQVLIIDRIERPTEN